MGGPEDSGIQRGLRMAFSGSKGVLGLWSAKRACVYIYIYIYIYMETLSSNSRAKKKLRL